MKLQRSDILFEDNHLLVVNKPAGLLAQGDEGGDECLLELARDYVRKKYEKPGNVFLGLVHRLDRPVSGVMVLARTSKAASRLSEQFRDRTVRKTYLAVVAGCPEDIAGELEHQMGRRADKSGRTPIAVDPFTDSVPARLRWRIVDGGTIRSVLRVEPETGRRHQIRAQLAAAGMPILGDRKYGAPEALPDRSIALHAWRLEIAHPVGGARTTFTARPPARTPWPARMDLD
jgi:23S rRNA pseudouridine1911/1915/1917 synthase